LLLDRTAAPHPPRREHSRKPDEVYARIEALGEGPYLEVFARFSRPGWDRWGLGPIRLKSVRGVGAPANPATPQAAD
jgi:hypothetical protein